MRFKITWSNCEYRVSIPRYKGGEVVTADEHDALLARHNALEEAVKKYFKSERLEILQRDARAEVDRLIANETAADCKGEG